MKKILLLLMCMFFLVGCGANTKKPNLTFTEGRILEPGEARGMLGVEGKITEMKDDFIEVNVAGEIYKFKLSEKFSKQLEKFKEKKYKIKEGTYVQIYYKEEKTNGSTIFKDVQNTEKVADSFSIIYEN